MIVAGPPTLSRFAAGWLRSGGRHPARLASFGETAVRATLASFGETVVRATLASFGGASPRDVGFVRGEGPAAWRRRFRAEGDREACRLRSGEGRRDGGPAVALCQPFQPPTG